MITVTEAGLYCERGNFFIDPWLPVERAVITHAHADHARPGCGSYLCAARGELVLRHRIGVDAPVQGIPYGEKVSMNGATISLHPAGHILGSAQIRIEHNGQVCVVSGDYKTVFDSTCEPFEPLRCHTFITESTFGLPIYRWISDAEIFQQINSWWQQNRLDGKTSLLLCYALGKAQRILRGIDSSIGPIFTHGAVQTINEVYRISGVELPRTEKVAEKPKGTDYAGSLILAPVSVQGTPWLRRLGTLSVGFASGWMRVRGMRRRKALDRGFVLSDHADWASLLGTIAATGAGRVLVTNGYSQVLMRYLEEHGIESGVLETRFEGEGNDSDEKSDGS
jgi:putative mRNA 3-end processing factor